jgi:hypothetical protein
MVQQVEVPPRPKKGDVVHFAESELLGYLDIERGPLGVWVQPYLHPAVQSPAALLASFIESYSDNRKRPLYFSVRSYQGGVMHGLERLGFVVHRDQAVMVKHLAVLIRHLALKPIPAVDGTRPEPTTPFAHLDSFLNRVESRSFPHSAKQPWLPQSWLPRPWLPQSWLPRSSANENSFSHEERDVRLSQPDPI